jgi:hypothetical protein
MLLTLATLKKMYADGHCAFRDAHQMLLTLATFKKMYADGHCALRDAHQMLLTLATLKKCAQMVVVHWETPTNGAHTGRCPT